MKSGNQRELEKKLKSDQQEREANQIVLKSNASLTIAALEAPTIAVFENLAAIIHGWNRAQGFWESENVGEKIALMHSELSEALEADRKDLKSDHIPEFSGVEEELADCLIRIFDFAGHFDLRLAEAFAAKLQFNLSRPFKHGKGY